MIEISVYGRAGQGVYSLGKMLASAFDFQGIKSHALPEFSAGMHGVPVKCYVRASRHFIKSKSSVELSDYSLVMDSSLIDSEDVIKKTKNRGTIIVNTSKELSISKEHRVICVDVTQVARKNSSKGINAGLLGAFIGATRVLQLKSVLGAVNQLFPESQSENSKMVESVYEIVRREIT